jgi:hypothetical protein
MTDTKLNIKLKKKRTALYPELFSLRISEEAKAMAIEMSNAKEDVAEPLRELVEPAIRELYKQFQKQTAS